MAGMMGILPGAARLAVDVRQTVPTPLARPRVPVTRTVTGSAKAVRWSVEGGGRRTADPTHHKILSGSSRFAYRVPLPCGINAMQEQGAPRPRVHHPCCSYPRMWEDNSGVDRLRYPPGDTEAARNRCCTKQLQLHLRPSTGTAAKRRERYGVGPPADGGRPPLRRARRHHRGPTGFPSGPGGAPAAERYRLRQR